MLAGWLVAIGFQFGVEGPDVFSVLSLTGLAAAVWNRRMRQVATFTTEAGAPVFSIRAPARERGAFDSLLAMLIQQIAAAKKAAPPPV